MHNQDQQSQDVTDVIAAPRFTKKLTKFTSYTVSKDLSARIDTHVKASKDRGAVQKVTHINYLPQNMDDWLSAECGGSESAILERAALLATYLTDTAVILAKNDEIKSMFSFAQLLTKMRDLHKLDIARARISFTLLRTSGFLAHIAAQLAPKNVGAQLRSLDAILTNRLTNTDFTDKPAHEQACVDLEQKVIKLGNAVLDGFAPASDKHQSIDFLDSLLDVLALRFVVPSAIDSDAILFTEEPLVVSDTEA